MKKLTALCVLAAAVLLPLATSAQNTRPTRVVVSFSAGGPVDMVARILSERLGQELGTAVIVDNKPGANGFLGAQDVLKAKPDGETMWLSSVGTAAINPSLFAQLPYDTQRDFRPVSLVANNVEVFVINGDDPAQSAQEFIDAARQATTAPAIASSGTGGIPHLAMVQLRQSTGVDFLHVPYRGMAQAIADVVGGQVSGVFADVAAVLPYLQSGRLRAVGIAAGQRHPSLPDVPTFEEQGISKLDSNNWYGLFVSKKTSDATVQRLNEAVQKTLADPAMQARLLQAGTQPQASSPEELQALLAADSAKWGELIRTNNIRPE